MQVLKKVLFYAVIFFVLSIVLNANAATATQPEASTALKTMLSQAAQTAVKKLGAQGGFSNNPAIKIELPGKLGSAAKVLTMFGMGKQLSQLENSMNAAAEAAIPEAQQMLINSIQQMTFTDAKAIVTGGDQAATAYLEKTNRDQLFNKLLPKVKSITAKSSLSTQYANLLKSANAFGVANDNLKIENYVTNKALDGLFKVIGEQESYIRNNPKQAASSVARRIFEALNK